MNFSKKCIEIVKIDIDEIKSFVNDLTEDDWNSWSYRQKSYDAHSNTKTYPLGWTKIIDDENLEVIIKNKFDSVWESISGLITNLESHYKGRCTNILFANLKSGKKIFPHVDDNYLKIIHRCHLPIQTNKDVKFIIGGECFFLEEGTLYEINNTLRHSVENNSKEDRIHLMIDVLPITSNVNLKFVCE